MAVEYRGEDILYAVAIPDETSGETTHRIFNQTGGNTNISADTIELDTKDKTGSDYGKVTQEISVEGIMTQDDPAIPYLKGAIRGKKLVKILEIDTRTLKAEEGMYMISSFERSYANSDYATYSLSGSLNGNVDEKTLTEVPPGAPDSGTP